MRFDRDFDVYVQLSVDRYARLWVNERQAGRAKKVRTAGRAPVGATPHTMLAIALVNALDSISPLHIENLRKELAKVPGEKLKLKIVAVDSTFADALRALMKSDKTTLADKPMRAGRNLLREMARLLARYEVELQTQRDDADFSFKSLRTWARRIDATCNPTASATFATAFPAFAMRD